MPVIRVPVPVPQTPLTAEDMERMVGEIDALVDECEKIIADTKSAKDRQWFLGARSGLLLAQAFARRVWPKDGRGT